MAHFSIIVVLVHDHHLEFEALASKAVVNQDIDVSLGRRVPERALDQIYQDLFETDLVSDQSLG